MATEWYYSKEGQQVGPVSTGELKQLAATGQLQPSELVWKDGMADWVPASTIKGLFSTRPNPANTAQPQSHGVTPPPRTTSIGPPIRPTIGTAASPSSDGTPVTGRNNKLVLFGSIGGGIAVLLVVVIVGMLNRDAGVGNSVGDVRDTREGALRSEPQAMAVSSATDHQKDDIENGTTPSPSQPHSDPNVADSLNELRNAVDSMTKTVRTNAQKQRSPRTAKSDSPPPDSKATTSPGEKKGGPPYDKVDSQTADVQLESLHIRPLGRLWEQRVECHCVAFRRDGKLMAVGGGIRQNVISWIGVVLLIDPTSGRTQQSLKIPDYKYVNSVAFSPDGKLLAIGGNNHRVHLLNISSADNERTIEVGGSVTSLFYTSNGASLMIAGGDFDSFGAVSAPGFVNIWNPETKSMSLSLKSKSPVTSLAMLPNGDFVTGDASGTMTACKSGGEVQGTIRAFDRHIYRCALDVSPDGSLIAISGRQNTSDVKLWNVKDKKWAATLAGHSSGVSALAFSPKGKLLVTAGSDGALKIWDTASTKEAATLQGHRMPIEAVAFSPNGSLMVTVSADKDNHGEVYAWSIRHEE